MNQIFRFAILYRCQRCRKLWSYGAMLGMKCDSQLCGDSFRNRYFLWIPLLNNQDSMESRAVFFSWLKQCWWTKSCTSWYCNSIWRMTYVDACHLCLTYTVHMYMSTEKHMAIPGKLQEMTGLRYLSHYINPLKERIIRCFRISQALVS